MSIRILNPLPGGRKKTSLRRAEYYVANGQAAWANAALTAIHFVDTERREEQKAAIVTQELITGWSYDGIGRVMQAHELKGLPCTGDVMGMLMRRSRRSTVSPRAQCPHSN